MSTANRVIKNTGFLYVKMGITMFISLYTTRLILNALGASDFGIFNIVGGAIAMLGFLNAAMASATQRFMSFAEGEGDKDKQKRIFNVSIILHFGIAILMGLALLIVGWFFFNGVLNIDPERIYAAKVVYASLIVSTIFTVMSVPYDAVLNAHENMLYYSIVGIVESLLKLGAALAVVYIAGDKLVLYGILMACVPLVSMTIMRIYCHNHYLECKIAPKRYFDRNLMKEMTGFAGWNFLGSMSGMLSAYGIGIIMNVFHGTVANAAQGIANQLSGQLGVFGGSIKKALNPVIAKSAGANDLNLMVKSTIYGTKIVFFVIGVFFLPFMLEMPYILKLWLKNPPPEAQIFCWLLLLSNLFDQLVLFLPQAISAIGKIKNYQAISSILSFLPLPIAAIAFKMGAPAYAIYAITAIISIFRGSVVMFFADKLCGISMKVYFLNVVLRCSVSFMFVLIIGYMISLSMSQGIFRLGVVIFGTTSIYAFSSFYIGLNREERMFSRIKLIELKGKLINKANFND